jgi:hypothetical protein
VSSLHRKLSLLAAATLAASTALAADPPAAPTTRDLNARLEALEAEITQIKAQQATQAQKQAETHTADELLKDANRHSQFLDAQGVLAGWTGGKFVLQSEDGNFLAHPWLQLQFRNVTTYRQDAKQGGTADDTQNGFEIRRLKFGVDGNLFGKQLTYFTQFAVDRKSGNVQLEQAYAKYQIDASPFAVRAGQFKDPLDHEQLASSKTFPAIDRTFTNDQFANAEGFVKGVSFIFDPNKTVRSEVAFHDGLRNFNTNFQDYPTTGTPANWGAAARVEFKAFGAWKDYEQISAYGVKQHTLVFGAGADYTETGHSSALVHVVDAQFQTKRGLSLYGAYLGRYTKSSIAAKGADTYDPTVRGQIAWAIDKHWEPYGRYEYVHFDSREFAAGTETNVQVITGGVNYYLYGQSFKVSADVQYLPNGSPVNDDGIGVLVSNGKTEIVGRIQFQLLL